MQKYTSMDPRKKQLLASTSQSLEKVSRFLGINLSSYIGKLYSLALIILFIVLSRISWPNICTGLCERAFIINFMVMLWYSLTILLLLTITSTSLFRPRQFAFPHQEIFIMDSILESYGARFTNKDIFLAKYLQDSVTAVIALLDVMINAYYIFGDNSLETICMCLITWYGRMCILVIDGLFSHHLNDIYLRCRELNKITIQHSRENLSVSYIDFTAGSNLLFNKCSNTIITKIRSIQHIHHGLYTLTTKINTNFGLQLLIISAISFLAIIFFLHDIYLNIENNSSNIGVLINPVYQIFFYALRFLYISYICQRTKNEFRQMANILHDAFLEYKSLRAEVVHFSLQLVHENLTFSALGLYEINIPLICSFAGSTVTYLVMVIQLNTNFAATNYNRINSYNYTKNYSTNFIP